jgi:hypothetical protein
MRLARFAFAVLLCAAPAAASASQVEIVDKGFYDVKVERSVPAPEDVSGERNVISEIQLRRDTLVIDAQLGRSFGYRFRIKDPALAGKVLKLRTKFPPLTNPQTGRTGTVQDREFVAVPGTTYYDGYKFDYDWEMAEGDWIFQVVEGERVLSEIKFKVVIALH